MMLGGPSDLVAEVLKAGGKAGPMSVWVTGGAIRWGTGNLDTHYASCKSLGVQPLVKFWFWGDDISTAAIKNGVRDQYQGTWKTRAIALELAKAIGTKAQAAGVSPIVAIEHEFAQNGLETDPSAFGPYFNEAAAVIKAACPSARIAFCCPIWEDETAIAKVYAAQIAKADLISSQTLLFAPTHPNLGDFTNAGANFVAAFGRLRAAAPGKPIAIVDLGFSSYGGAYSKTHPYAGGDGKANEALQAQAIKSVADAAVGLDLEFVCYRSLRDNPGFDVANFGGEAEKFVGCVRADGTKKPAYGALTARYAPAGPTPLEVAQATVARQAEDIVALKAQVAHASADAAAWKARFTAIQTALRDVVGPYDDVRT